MVYQKYEAVRKAFCLLPACAAKEHFLSALVLLILLCKINKTSALRNLILPPQATEYFLDTPILFRQPHLLSAAHRQRIGFYFPTLNPTL